ncbi:MAG: hypothetical protein Kow0042_29350 [Calditrichia bacterium]
MAALRKRVLVVDDEEDLTWTLSKKLSKDKDKFELIAVNSGREAIEVLNQLPVDLVITDVRMPEVSGLELLVEIKEKFPQTKVVIMTAYGSSDVQKSANERGCFRYIEKPFEINELRELILEALTEKKGFRGSVADFQLSDIIQLNCLGRLTSALQVNTEQGSGLIFFEEGNIVHAETRTLEGENAFYHIMSWEGGEFVVKRNLKAPRETINKGWQSLLLEALKRSDEASDSMIEEKEREKRQRIHNIHWALNTIFKSQGVLAIFIYNEAGFPITFLKKEDQSQVDMTDLGNQFSALLKVLHPLKEKLNSKFVNFLEMHFGKTLVIVRKIVGKDAYITVIGNSQVNIAFLRLELHKAAKKIKDFI